MFGLLKVTFYTFVAVIVGVVIGTVPIEGRTIADRIASAYDSMPSAAPAAPEPPSAPPRASGAKRAARAEPKARPMPAKAAVAAAPVAPAAPAVPAAPVTAGAANSPERHTDEDRAALDAIISKRARK